MIDRVVRRTEFTTASYGDWLIKFRLWELEKICFTQWRNSHWTVMLTDFDNGYVTGGIEIYFSEGHIVMSCYPYLEKYCRGYELIERIIREAIREYNTDSIFSIKINGSYSYHNLNIEMPIFGGALWDRVEPYQRRLADYESNQSGKRRKA